MFWQDSHFCYETSLSKTPTLLKGLLKNGQFGQVAIFIETISFSQ